jgi:hypothetical protein
MEPLNEDWDPDSHCDNIPDRPLGLLTNDWHHQKTDTSKEHDCRETQPDLPDSYQSVESLFRVAGLGAFGTSAKVLLPKPLEDVYFAAFGTIAREFLDPGRDKSKEREERQSHRRSTEEDAVEKCERPPLQQPVVNLVESHVTDAKPHWIRRATARRRLVVVRKKLVG